MTTVDLATNGRPPEGELGTVIDRDPVIGPWNNGLVFTPTEATVRQIDDMLKADGKARTLEQALTLPLRRAAHTIEESDNDRGEAEFARDALGRAANSNGMTTPLDLVLAQMTGARLYRVAYFEKVFKEEDGRIVYDKLAYRPPATCRLKRDKKTGAFQGFEQRVWRENKGAEWVTIKPEKALVFVHGQHRQPVKGTSDLETVYAIWQIKQKIKYLWASFLENQSMPKAIAQTDGSESPGALAGRAAQLRGAGVLGITEGQSVEPFESSGKGAGEFQNAMAYLDSEMAGSVLAGFTNLTSPDKAGGSYALSKDSTNFFNQSCEAVLNEMAATMTNWAVADLVRWNFGREASVPTFKFGPLVDEHVEHAMEMFRYLATTPNPALPGDFLDLLAVKVASYLDLDEKRVEEAIERARSEASTPIGELRQGVDAALGKVREAGLGVAT